jgi:hypothetical protein
MGLTLLGPVRLLRPQGPVDLGRAVVAARDIRAGELLFREEAFAQAPRREGWCHGCLAPPVHHQSSLPQHCQCIACNLHFCGECWSHGAHKAHLSECLALGRRKGLPSAAVLLAASCWQRSHWPQQPCAANESLRFDALMSAGPDETGELQQRAAEAAELLAAAAELREATPPTPRQLLGVVRRLDRNALCVGDHTGIAGSALFRCTSMFNHSCRPNAFIWFVWGQGGGGGGLPAAGASCAVRAHKPGTVCAEVRASQDISEGSEVCLGYTDALGKPRSERRPGISVDFGFDCACSACNEEEGLDEEEDTLSIGTTMTLRNGSMGTSVEVLRGCLAQARELWLSCGDGSSLNLGRAAAILQDALECCACEQSSGRGCSAALRSVVSQMQDTLASVQIALGRYHDARECLGRWASGRRAALAAAYGCGYPAVPVATAAPDLMLAVRQIDQCRIAMQLATEADHEQCDGSWAQVAWAHARDAQAQLLLLVGEQNARNVFADKGLEWDPAP